MKLSPLYLLMLFNYIRVCVGIEFSFEDFGVLSDGVRKRLAYSWEADMEFTMAKEVVISEIERRIAAGELSVGGNTKAPDLAEKVAKSLSDLLARRSQAVEKVAAFVEEKSATPTWDPTLTTQNVHITQMKDIFNVVRNENFGDEVNTSFSAVHIPIDIFEGGISILNDMNWSSGMDAVFVENANHDPSVNWQYFASGAGWLRQWPARQCQRDPDLYDARMEPWYLQGLSAPKHLLILIDTSGSTQGMIRQLIKVAATSLVNMLADWDRVSVATFSEMVSWPSCAHRFLPATPLNKQLLTEAIANLIPKGQAQLEPVLRFALEQFADLENVSSANFDGYATCNKFVAILTDGDETFDPDDFIESYRNMSVRIFVYGIGPTITGQSSLEDLAVKTNGEYQGLRQMNAVRHTVQNLHVKLSSLSSHGWENHPVLVATVSEHNEDASDVHYSEPVPDNEGYRPSLAVAKPAFNRSESEDNSPPRVIGVAGADIRTDELIHTLNPVLYDPAGYAFIVAHNGYVILHSRHMPRKVGPSESKDPRVIAFTEVPIHIVDSENSAVPLLSFAEWEEDRLPVVRERKTTSLLYYGNKDYASEEKRWLAYSAVSNSSLGVVVSIRENGVETLVPTDKLPLDFSLREVPFGEVPYYLDLTRICAAAGAIVDKHILRLHTPVNVVPSSTVAANLSTTTASTTIGGSGSAPSTAAADEEEDLERFGTDAHTVTTTTPPQSTVTTTQPTTTTAPPPNYGLLAQEAAITFLQTYGNNPKAMSESYCDQTAVRHVGLDLILLRQLISSLPHLQMSADNSTAEKPKISPNFHLNEEGLPLEELFVGQSLAWAIVFPSGLYYSRPSNGLSMACITDPLKLAAYQHAAYTRDRVFAQPAPCPAYSIVARSIHMRSLSLATVIVIYNSSSLLPENCTNCMLLDDGGFLLAATNKTVARSIGTALELFDYSLYNLLVRESNVFTSQSTRMLVRPCPPGSTASIYSIIPPDIQQESSAISSFLRSAFISQLTSISWWATIFSSFGRILAEAAAQAAQAAQSVTNSEEEMTTPSHLDGSGVPDATVTEAPSEAKQAPSHQHTEQHAKTKCSRESLADDWGLPRKGHICAIRHPTLIPGPSFYISQLRPFACGHYCTRTAAWAPVRGTNLLFVVADPPCAGCANQSPTRHASGFSYETDQLFDTCQMAAGPRTMSSVFTMHQYFEQPEQIDWKCTPLVFPPPSLAVSVHQSKIVWSVFLALLIAVLPYW